MKTQKEYAKELVEEMSILKDATTSLNPNAPLVKQPTNIYAKECALIAVEKMIDIIVMVFDNNDSFIENPILGDFADKRLSYLEGVRNEIPNL
jgi:hypothetical protein